MDAQQDKDIEERGLDQKSRMVVDVSLTARLGVRIPDGLTNGAVKTHEMV